MGVRRSLGDLEDVPGEKEDADKCCPDRGHQHRGRRDILGAANHRVPFRPRVIDEHLKRSVEELGGDDHGEAEQQTNELDRREMEEKRGQQHEGSRNQVKPEVCLLGYGPGEPSTGMSDAVSGAGEVESTGPGSVADARGFAFGVGRAGHGADAGAGWAWP